MNVKKISVVDAISFAFKSIIDHIRLFLFTFFIGSGLIVLVVGMLGLFNKSLIIELMSSPLFHSIQECIGSHCLTVVYQSGKPLAGFILGNALPLFIATIIMALFFTCLDLGFKTLALELYDTNQSAVDRLWSCFHLAITGFVAWTLYCIMTWIGFMLFIIPGFIILLRFGFFPFFIIDKKVNAIDALRKSYQVTRGHMWEIFAFWLAIKVIVYVGFLTYIGAIVTWPISTLAYAYVYRQLVPHS
jgi:hypothetical protein